MKAYTKPNPQFSDTIQITEITDAAHADNINAAPKQLLGNTLFLNKKMEQAEQMINDKATEIAKNNNEFEQRVAQTIESETKQRFKDLYGLANKTVTLSADGSTVTSVSGDIKVTTTISKSGENTTLTTVVEKGEEEQDGYEKYTKTTVMSTLTDGRKQVTVNYVKNV